MTVPTEDITARLEVTLAVLRNIPLEYIVNRIRSAERAESVGPLIHPSMWTSAAFKMHSASLDVLRRVEDLRRALITLDEVQQAVGNVAVTPLLPKEP